MLFQFTVMVWKDFSHDLVICNSYALDSGLINCVMPNHVRVEAFGEICFSHDWADLLAGRPGTLASIDEADVLSADADASIHVGDVWMPPAFADLPPAAQHYARQFPNFLMPIPEFADVRLPVWEAHVP